MANPDPQDLARLVPSLASARRLNKVLIIKESIKHFTDQRDMCVEAAREIQEVISENRRLAAELNALRSQVVGGPLVVAAQPKPVTEAMTRLMGVRDEVYGVFNNGFGDNWAAEAEAEGEGIQQRSRSGTADHLDVRLAAVDGFFPAAGEHTYLAQLSPPAEPNPLGGDIPFTIPDAIPGQQAVPWGFMAPADDQAQPTPLAPLDLFAPGASPPVVQPLENIAHPADFDLLSQSWMQGTAMGDEGPYLLQGIGNGDTSSLR